MVLVLLDLSAAFDTIDHNILVSRLEKIVGIRGMALEWFKSFRFNRKFSVHFGQHYSKTAPLSSGVPQGSILGPILFSLYMLPLGSIFHKHGVSFHCYADGTQVYLPLLKQDKSSFKSQLSCLHKVKSWMSQNYLNLNESKTEIICFGAPDTQNSFDLGNLAPFCKSVVKNLGVKFDSSLKFDKKINSVVKSGFFHLRSITKVKPFLSSSDFERIIHAFISVKLDYCNSLYVGISQVLLNCLQLVQNAAAKK